jgi:UDPglucose 6-dehydrogenase
LEKARLCIYDPQVAPEQVKRDLREAFSQGDGHITRSKQELIDQHVTFADSCEQASEDAHAIAVLTEWDEFAEVDFDVVFEKMKKPAFVFDGRNKLKALHLADHGFDYYGIGF